MKILDIFLEFLIVGGGEGSLGRRRQFLLNHVRSLNRYGTKT